MRRPIRSVIVGLGANVGDRLTALRRAVDLLHQSPSLCVVAVSRIYDSDPLGPPQPRYLNAAARIETDLPLLSVLEIAQAIEAALGRVRGERWGPRTLDIDLLWTDAEGTHTADLVVPHPGLFDRAFALAPLLDVLCPAPPAFLECLAALGGAPPLVTDILQLPK